MTQFRGSSGDVSCCPCSEGMTGCTDIASRTVATYPRETLFCHHTTDTLAAVQTFPTTPAVTRKTRVQTSMGSTWGGGKNHPQVRKHTVSKKLSMDENRCTASQNTDQGRPVNVKHDARCVMGKVGGEDKKPKKGGNLIYCYKFAVIG